MFTNHLSVAQEHKEKNISAATKGALDVDEGIFSSMSFQYLLRITGALKSCATTPCP